MFKEMKTNGMSGGGEWTPSGTPRPAIKSPRTLVLPEHMDGEQLEEMIAATPLDLSVFSVQTKPIRNAESPLDLSLKTRKRTADSTDENHIQLCVFTGSKRVCQGVAGTPEPLDRVFAFRPSLTEYEDTHSGNKGDLFKRQLSTGFDAKPTVIKNGFSLDKGSTPPHSQEHQYHYYQQKQQQQHQHQQHLQQLKIRQQDLQSSQQDLSPQQLLSQKHQMEQQRQQQMQLSQQHQQQKQHHQQQQQQLLSKQHQMSPQEQLSKHHQLSQQQSLSTQQQVSLHQQLIKQQQQQQQLTPQQQLSQHHQQKLKQQQQQQKLHQQQQLHGFDSHSQYNKQDNKTMGQTTQQEQVHSNAFFQQEHKQRQLQRQHHHQHHQQQQRQSRDDIVHERYMQPKISEKSSTALAGYAQHRPRKHDIQPGQHVLPGYSLCDNTRAAKSSQHMDTSQLFYSKQVESRGSMNQPFTVKHSAMDALGFSNELQKTSIQKQANVKYSTSAGHSGFTGLSINTTGHSGGTVLAGPNGHSGYSSHTGQSGRTNVSGFGPSTSLQYYNMSGGTMSRRHSPHFEAIQRCSPDSTMSTNSPKQFHSDTETYDRLKQQRAMLAADQSRRLEQGAGFTSHLTPASHTFAEPHSPAGNTTGSMYSRESSPGVLSRGSPSAYRGHSPSALRQHSAQSRGSSPSCGRNVLPYLSHSLSPLVHSAMSPVIPMSRAPERSIIKGTSGVCKATPSDNQGIHSNTNVCDSKISVQHSVLKHSTVQRTVPDRVPSDGAATKPSDTMDQIVRIKEEKPFPVPKHLPTCRSVLNNEKTLQNDIKKEKGDKCQTVEGNADDVRKAEEPEIEKYTYPLTIAIPGSTAATSTNQSSQSTAKENKPSETVVVKAPRPYSKKQIIMNAVNNDECLKKIVNTVTPPRPKPAPYVTSDPHHLNQNCFQNPSPTFPESPKMPTLSPQQKLSPAMVSPLTGEPPTLDPPDVSSQRLRLDSKLSVVRKFSLGGLSDKSENRLEDTSGFGDGDSRSCRGDHSLMGGNSFSKWNSGYSKNIPVANVSPMVHGHSTTSSKTKADVTRLEESCDNFKGDVDPNKPVDHKPSSISVSETFGDIKFDERFIDDDLLVLDKNDVSNFSRSRNVMKSLNRQKQISGEQTDKRKTVISDSPGQSDVEEEDSNYERKYCTSRSQSADKSRSSSADKSRSSSADKSRSMLAEIANSEGYVAESKVKVKTDDLLTDDPATLGREQRALLRAIKRFEEMEEKIDQPPSSPKSAKQSNTKLKADEIRRKARGTKQRMSRTDRILGRQKWIGRRKKKKKIVKPKGFIDFKPKVLEPRTRTQAAGKKPTYDRNAAYDRELSREECRKALKRRERLRQTARRICRRMSEKQEKLAQERRLSREEASENKDSSESGKVVGENGNKESETEHSGMWEIGDSSSALRQTLRSGKSKGGLMMTLLFKPKHLRFGRRHSPRRGGYQLRTTRDANGARSKRLELGNKLEGARRRGQAARRKLNDQRRQHSTEQQEQPRHLVAIGDVNDSADGPLPFVDEHLEASSFDAKAESSNDGSYPLPPEVKKLAICRDTGETILHRAARMGHTEIALHCVQSGRVDVNVRDNAGYTPLHESCVSGHRGIAHLLLSRGASVNCSSQDGIRPIHDAVENDNVELVRMLLAFGADPTLSTYGGKTPLKIARSDRMKQLLEGHLGDLNGFACDQDRSVWPCAAFEAADKTFPGTSIFNDIPADPVEEDESDYIMESRDPEFTCFKLAKTDNKNASGNHVLLNDVTDFLQIQLDDVLSDSSVKSMVTNVSKTRLAVTSYGQTHPERVSRIPGTSGKAVQLRGVKEVFDVCSKRKAAAKSALAQSNFPHKFKHYKLQKGYDSQFDTPSTSGRETSRFPQVGMTKCNFEETNSKNSLTSSRGCKLDLRTATASSDCASVSDSVYDFDDVTDDFADVADNFSMRIGAVPEDFRVFNGYPNVTGNCKQDVDSNL